MNIKVLIKAAIDSIARRTSRVKGKHRHNKVKEAILLIIIRRKSDICNNICSDCGEVCSKVCNKVCGKVCGEVWAIFKIRRNMATFHLNIYSNLCSLENKSMILGVF